MIVKKFGLMVVSHISCIFLSCAVIVTHIFCLFCLDVLLYLQVLISIFCLINSTCKASPWDFFFNWDLSLSIPTSFHHMFSSVFLSLYGIQFTNPQLPLFISFSHVFAFSWTSLKYLLLTSWNSLKRLFISSLNSLISMIKFVIILLYLMSWVHISNSH